MLYASEAGSPVLPVARSQRLREDLKLADLILAVPSRLDDAFRRRLGRLNREVATEQPRQEPELAESRLWAVELFDIDELLGHYIQASLLLDLPLRGLSE